MKTFLAFILLIGLPLGLDSTFDWMNRNQKMLVCYNAEGGGYFWPFITYRCTFVPRGKGY